MDTALSQMPIIDMDTHYNEPADLWTSRAPAKFRSVAPRIEGKPGEGQFWVVGDGIRLSLPGICVIRADGTKAYGTFTLATPEEMSPAATDVGARLRVMDDLGLAIQVVFPNVLGFAGAGIMRVQDEELRNFCTSAYNDAAAEMQVRSGGRLYPQALLPFWDINAAAKELERAHDQLGLTGFTMIDSPEQWELPSLCDPHWDPIWARAQERGMPCNFHIGSGGLGGDMVWKGTPLERSIPTIASVLFLNNGRCIANLIFSGLLDRFPSLKFVSVESGIGWLPFLLAACEYQMRESVPEGSMKLRPTEYFQRQIYASFWFESDLAEPIKKLGENNVMFETDFPHPTCLYPNPREHVHNALKDLEPRIQRKILYENAARVYQLKLPS